eukprot:1614704-Alexandrium_andersonii.AAC.1
MTLPRGRSSRRDSASATGATASGWCTAGAGSLRPAGGGATVRVNRSEWSGEVLASCAVVRVVFVVQT